MVLLNRPNDPSPYDGLILVEPSALKNENRYWTNCRRRVGFEFIDTDTSWPNSWRMAFSVPTGINEFGIKYAVARDADGSVARSFKVTGTPTIIFLDRKGVVSYFANQLPEDYAQRLDALLTETR